MSSQSESLSPSQRPVTRNLVVCCDGTNNTLTGDVNDSNVLRLFVHLRHYANAADTVLYYNPGVGSPDSAPPTGLIEGLKRSWGRLHELGSGRGVYEDVRDAYVFLMRNLRSSDDRIFCFGFSRGAFTARSVAGMVDLFGVLRPEHEPIVPTLVRIYFSQSALGSQIVGRARLRKFLFGDSGLFSFFGHLFFSTPLAEGRRKPAIVTALGLRGSGSRELMSQQVRSAFARPAIVHWIGVWDTVESVGFPLFGSLENQQTFFDRSRVRHIRHALALDEHRWSFLPRLYDSPSEVILKDRSFKQFWFPGVHGDVGGSYHFTRYDSTYREERTGLCDRTLAWMIDEVADQLNVPALSTTPEWTPGKLPLRHDPIYEIPLYALLGMTVRNMRTKRIRTYAEVDDRRNREALSKSVSAIAPDPEASPVQRRASAWADKVLLAQYPDVPEISVDIKAHGPAHLKGPSVWDERRPTSSVYVALFVALVACLLSAGSLIVPDRRAPDRMLAPEDASCSFALQRVAIVSPIDIDIRKLRQGCEVAPAGGLRQPAEWKRYSARGLGWSLVFDVTFAIALGYVLARLASRVFTWAAGFRRPGQNRTAWLVLMGWLPAAAVGAHVLEDFSMVVALALDALGWTLLIPLALFAVGTCFVVKVLAYAIALPVFSTGRLLLATPLASGVGKVGRRGARAIE